MYSIEELKKQSWDFYERHAEYLREVEPIVREMEKLKSLFADYRLVIDVSDFTIEEEWLNAGAAQLYDKYAELLGSIQDRFVANQQVAEVAAQ